MSLASRKSVRNALAAAALVAASVALMVIFAEVALRLVFPPAYLIWKPSFSTTFLPAPGVMPGVSGESRLQINSLGLRANELKPADAYRILMIGGSTTECLFLDQTETWPQLVQDALNSNPKAPRTWVGNGGLSGRNSRHHVMALRHLPLGDMKVDAIVVLAGANDLSIQLSQGDAFDPMALQKPDQQRKLFEETFTSMRRGNPHEPWLKQTMLWQLARTLKAKVIGKPNTGLVQDRAGDTYVKWRKHRQEATDIRPTLPDLSAGLDEYTRNLKEMAALARARSTRLILLTQPTMWGPGLPRELESLLWLGGIGEFQARPGQPYYAAEPLAEGLKRYNDAMLAVCKTEGLECIDLTHLERDVSTYYDDFHFNENGAKKVARIVSTYLQSKPPFNQAPSTPN